MPNGNMTRPTIDLDATQQRRVNRLVKRAQENEKIPRAEIFLSDQVVSALDGQKILLQSFDKERVLALLPFAKNVFVMACPRCLAKEDLETFSKLVSSNLIMPILVAPYSYFPGDLRNLIHAHDHISAYEYDFYRYTQITTNNPNMLCAHCVEERHKEIVAKIKRNKETKTFKRYLERTVTNLDPCVAPDYELLDAFEAAVQDRTTERARQLADFSAVLASARDAQVFGAPLLVPDDHLEMLAAYKIPQTNALSALSIELRELIIDGLGLKIPADMPIDQYIGLVKDIQPEIQNITKELLPNSKPDTNGAVSLRSVFNSMRTINRDIERISRSTRYLLLDTAVSAVRNNKDILAGVLTASALGLAGGAVACATGAAGGLAATIMKRTGRLKSSPALARLGQAIHRDLEPVLNKLIAAYVGSTEITIQVMSTRNQISEAYSVSAKPSNQRTKFESNRKK